MSIVLAFSGGLDTSFCVPYLKETTGRPVHTVTVDTGGVPPDGADALKTHALSLGAASHHLVDGKASLFDDHLSYLIKGNVLRGGVYPLCVGPERIVQAKAVVKLARTLGATAIAHGSTGAGNDQVRFDVALSVLAGDLDVLAPIRSLGLSREESAAYLKQHGIDVSAETTAYSINRGLWGTTVGGAETLTPHVPLPADAYPDTSAPEDAPDASETVQIEFEDGLPVAVNGTSMSSVDLVEHLNALAGAHGVGRGIHVGDTILGIKGRVGFEAPAALLLIEAHQELEKVVLSKWQQIHKAQAGDLYGRLMHEGQYFDPVMRDLEAFLDHTQTTVTGTVTATLYKGSVRIDGVDSPHSLFDASTATYGEENALWDGRDAEGFTRIAGVPSQLARRASRLESDPVSAS